MKIQIPATDATNIDGTHILTGSSYDMAPQRLTANDVKAELGLDERQWLDLKV